MCFVVAAIRNEQPVIHRAQQQVITGIAGQAELLEQGLGHVLGHLAAARWRKILPAFRVVGQRARHAAAHLQIGREIRRQLEGPRVFDLGHAGQPRAILHHDHRLADHVPQSLEATVHGHHDQAHGEDRNQRDRRAAQDLGRDHRPQVNGPHDVSQDRLIPVDRAPVGTQHANAQDTFARRLTVPVSFEQTPVKPAENELGEDPDRHGDGSEADRQHRGQHCQADERQRPGSAHRSGTPENDETVPRPDSGTRCSPASRCRR